MRDVSRFLGGLATLVALLALPPAVAIGQGVPPNSEVDQYVPDFPSGEGDQAIGGKPGGGSKGGGSEGGGSEGAGSLPPANLEELRSLGPTGESAANFFDGGSAPGQSDDSAKGAGDTGAGGGGDEVTSVTAASGDSESSLGALLDTLAGDGEQGMGVVFPFLLGVIAAGGVAFVLTRRVRGQNAPRSDSSL